MSANTSQPRQPKGVPVGGQYAAESRPSGSITLMPDLAGGSSSEAPTDLPPGITEADEDLFTNHHCDVLAEALQRRTGWPAVVVGVPRTGSWVHAGVRSPTGEILDVQGLHDSRAWFDAYAEWCDGLAAMEEDVDYDPDEVDIAELAAFPDRRPPSDLVEVRSEAERVADLLVRQFGQEPR